MKGPPVYRQGRLPNGLRVLIHAQPTAPVSAVYLWIDAGTADEGPELAGAAHFLEHLVFKGTERRGVGQAASEIEGLGGDLNAYTTWDQTVLHATVAGPWWRRALDVVADMATQARFEPAGLESERQVVIDEIRSYDDDPDAVAEDQLAALLYPDHPYGRPILGTAASVQGLDRDRIMAFWRACWAPNRAILSVAGPVDADEVLQAAEALLGRWAPQDPRPPLPVADPAGGQTLAIRKGFDSTAALIGWRIPPLGHPDLPALDVLAAALGQGQSSLLTQRLQLQEHLASGCWADATGRVGGGALTLGFIPLQGDTGEAVRGALDVVARVGRSGLPGAVVARARDAMVSDFLFSHETVDGIAHDQAWYTARMGGVAQREVWLRALAAVRAEDVGRVAQRWLTPENATVVTVDRELDDEGLRAAVQAGRQRWRPARGAFEVGQVYDFTLDNGIRLRVLPDGSEVAAIRTVARGGSLAVPDRMAGMASAWAAMIPTGAGPYDASGYGQACDVAATAIDAIAGRNTIGLQATFPASNLEDAAELICWPLLDPRFQPWEWERVRDELLEDLRTLPDRPGEVANRLMAAALWPGHPWRLPFNGTPGSLQRITPAALTRWHAAQLDPTQLVVAVVGGVDPHATRDILEPWLSQIEAPEDALPRAVPGPIRIRHRTAHAGQEQATVIACTRGASMGDPRRHPLAIAAAILGAQGGRLFMDLREARGLGYAVWATHLEGLDGGILQAGLTCDPTRVSEASSALRAALQTLATTAPSAEEVDRAQKMLAGQRAMGLQRVGARATELATSTLYGLPYGVEPYQRALQGVSPGQVTQAFASTGAADPTVLTILPRRPS